MASNPNVNKVVYGNDTLIDLTEDTVTADKILQGYTAHDRSGAGITGTYVAPATPTDITPSNTTPPALSIDVPVNPKDTGHAIKSYVNTTPTLDGVYFPSGFNKMGISGYAYSQEPEVEDYELLYDNVSTTSTSHTISNMKGKTVLVLLFSWYSSSNYANTRFDNATATGGTIEKVCNLLDVSARTQGTFYTLDVTSNHCVISVTNASYIKVFDAVGIPLPTQLQIKTGRFIPDVNDYKVTLGFRPKYISVMRDSNGNAGISYNADISVAKYYRSLSGASEWRNLESDTAYIAFESIDSDGFTMYVNTSNYKSVTWYYFAIGEEEES